MILRKKYKPKDFSRFMKEEYSKISPTAIFCARMRAKQNVPFAKEIIKLVDTKYSNFVEDLPDYGDALTSKSNFIPFIEGRYYSLNEVLKHIKNAFIVEIASGLSPRSLEFLNKPNIIYLDTELEGLTKLKEQIVKEIIKGGTLSIANLFFMSINPLDKNDMDKLGKFYLKNGKNKNLILIHEGLLMYFSKAEKTILRNNIKYLFEKYAKKGIWFTSDFSRLKSKLKELKGKENIRNKISRVTNRKFDYFESEDETIRFLNSGGFKTEVISNEKVVNDLIKSKSLQSKREEILKSAKGYKVWKSQLS